MKKYQLLQFVIYALGAYASWWNTYQAPAQSALAFFSGVSAFIFGGLSLLVLTVGVIWEMILHYREKGIYKS